MMYDLVIKNGTVVTAVSTTQTDVAIRGEKIAAIGEGLVGQREIDAAGKLVTPEELAGELRHPYFLPSMQGIADQLRA